MTLMKRAALLVMVVTLALVAVAVVAYRFAVSDGAFEAEFPIDHTFDEALLGAITEREPVLLSEMTDFPWETVSVFNAGVTREAVEEVTGVTVFDRAMYTTTERLLVFCGEEKVVRVLPYTVDNLGFGPRATFSSAVRVVDGRLDDDGVQDPPPSCG